jgi:hypothetical protein
LKFSLVPKPDANGIAMYQIDISAQNGTVKEYLWFRKGKRNPWEYTVRVERQFIKSQIGKTTNFGYTILLDKKWNEGGAGDQSKPQSP